MSDTDYEHKARKYHVKIQRLLEEQYTSKGKQIPEEYKMYTQEFDSINVDEFNEYVRNTFQQ
jgi:hypothetical protein